MQSNNVPNRTTQLINKALSYLRDDDYIEYYNTLKKIPEEVINYCKHPNSYFQGVFPDALELVIENGTDEEFNRLFKFPELTTDLNGKIEDCAFYGRLSMLKKIFEKHNIDTLSISNSLFHALNEEQYEIAEYLLERNINNILAYDYILKNKERSTHCNYLFKQYGDRMKELYNF
jgi:hypothetical protein